MIYTDWFTKYEVWMIYSIKCCRCMTLMISVLFIINVELIYSGASSMIYDVCI
ncbi:hypothetical protein JHK82_045026 [Glycine max]|nr:hypothetical protein JHK86_045444 [Glycine max]KAG4941356.1 hypothetical protein JHK87_045227 [Glycine soja]KAG5099974.1 hypothetical protein JHK82_045026 [Glycine max]KAG5108576.1 hypothetical protein JHK84_045483 [Glycine max]